MPEQPPRNPYLCLVIVGLLGGLALVSLIGMIILALKGSDTPGALPAIASAAIGALASFLTNVPRGSNGMKNGG